MSMKAPSDKNPLDLLGNSPQILTLIEPKTQVPVILVGCMHYNPTSIKLAKETVELLGNNDMLHSLVLETCPDRWYKTLTLPQNVSFIKSVILDNEMESSALACQLYNRPIILGDQDINITTTRIKELFQVTVDDLLKPNEGGWTRIYDDFITSIQQTIFISQRSINEKYLEWKDVFAPRLMLGTPVSLLRYPTAILLKSPVVGTLLILSLMFSSGSLNSFALDVSNGFFHDGTYDSSTSDMISISSIQDFIATLNHLTPQTVMRTVAESVETVVTILIETAVFSRVFFLGLLSERNIVIADRIKIECEKSLEDAIREASPSVAIQSNVLSLWDKLLGKKEKPIAQPALKRRAVIAVLGMAHCNGIKKILINPSDEITSV